jgi:CheY-like chemotaxis protein
MLGGDLTVESVFGSGSTFTLLIDVGPIDSSKLEQIEDSVGQRDPSTSKKWANIHLTGRFLLAEDGPDNQRLISMYLRKAGAEVQVVGNGKLAVDRVLAEQAAGNPFRAVVMDIQMPELDGYTAVSQLRTAGITTPVVALTAHAMSGDRAKCLSYGFTDYATKPVDRTALLQILANLAPPCSDTDSPAPPRCAISSILSSTVFHQQQMNC